MYHPHERLVFQKRDGNLTVEIRQDKDGHRRVDLIRSYEENGELKTADRERYADQHRNALLLKAAKDWINEQDKAEGQKREAERPKEAGDWTKGLRYGQRRLLKAAEGRTR